MITDDRRKDFELTMKNMEMEIKRINAFFVQQINDEDMGRLKSLSVQLDQLVYQRRYNN